MTDKELLEIIDQAAKDGRTELDLSGKNIKSLPPELAKLTNLTELDLSYNQLTSLPPEIGKLTNLTRLFLSDNQLTSVPPELAKLTNLTRLDLSNNRLTSVPLKLGQLTNLTWLSLSDNQLTSLPPQLLKLTNLEVLDLYNNQLTSVPPQLGQLTNLEVLSLSNNQLTSIPPELGKLTNLTGLSLFNNQLTSVPPELAKLANLTGLSLSNNQLTSLPPQLGQLTNLTVLFLDHNQLTSVPPQLIELANLTWLSLSNNQLTSLPPQLGQLTNLKVLSLYNNQLTSLPAEILNLNIAINWKWEAGKEGILLADNPWERPPVEIIKRGKEAIRAWFEALEEEGGKRLNEVKVLLVGYGGAGKTSLVRKLTTGKFKADEPKTHGVKITDWKIKADGEDIAVHFWDYGGQGIMQATHRVFFSQRSLYILVIDARQESDPEEWLKNIESIGGKSPVMVLINKIDEHPFGLNEPELERKYPNIKGFYHVSCKKGSNILSFKDALIEQVMKVPTKSIEWPDRWARVKERIGKMRKDYIGYSEYEGICKEKGVVQKDKQKELIGVLHELGVMLHFPDKCLPDMEVLNPEWATEGIYKIINSKKLKECKGLLPADLLEYVLNVERLEDGGRKPKKYSKDEQRYIVELMNKFELCYKLDDGTILVPDLLTEQEPREGLPKEPNLRFYFEYDFMPAVLMPRFMVQKHKDIDVKICWRTGAVLKDKSFGAVAVVRQDKNRRRIYVEVTGSQARDYFATIRKTITDINKSFEKLPFTEWVPLPDAEEYVVKYKDLIGHERVRRREKFVGELEKGYSVAELLGRIESREETLVHINTLIAGDKSHIEIGRRMKGNIVADEVNIEIKIEQAIGHLDELKKIVEKQPEEKVGGVIKRKGLEIIHDALKDVAKRQITDAAKKIWELGKEFGPVIINTAAYNFFKNMMVG